MMRLARELGYTLGELSQRMTPEELNLWHAVFQAEHQEIEEEQKKQRRRRR
jgi:hypothetical protein